MLKNCRRYFQALSIIVFEGKIGTIVVKLESISDNSLRRCLQSVCNVIMGDNKEIAKWLSHMNSEGSCTAFPSITIDKQQITDRTNVRNENPSINHLRNAIAETSAENTALAREVSELINKLQISPQSVANDVKESLHKVSVVLRINGLTDADETALIVSMDGKRIREKKQQRMSRAFKAYYTNLSNRHSVLKKKLNYLKANVGSINNSIAENEVEYKNEYSSYKLLTAKLVEYTAAADAMESNIDSLNLKELEPDKIHDKYNRFVQRKGQLRDINQALIPYGDLPPNLMQAKALLDNKELEFNEITQKFLRMTYS